MRKALSLNSFCNTTNIFVHQHEGALNSRERSLRLKEEEHTQKLRQRKLMRYELTLVLGSISAIATVFLIGLGIGAISGVNLPDGTVCHRSNLPCNWLRLRQPKGVF